MFLLQALLSARRRAAAPLLFSLAAMFFAHVPALAVETHVWEQSDDADFSRGTANHLSIRSDGHLALAPEFKELDSTTVPYLWAIAQDSKGTIYYAGGAPTGATTKILALSPGGKPRQFAELSGLEIHALAVDSQDRVYAAALPDAKVYRINEKGKADLFFDPHAKYVWALAFDRSGNLFVATGDGGLIYKVAPDGNGTEFANTSETHARSMIMDEAGDLIVGTEPGGLVERISPKGEKFVLFQTRKREVTAVAERDGVFYAVAVGTKPPVVSGPPPVLPAVPAPVNPAGGTRVATAPPSAAPPIGSLSATIGGGSDFYRIQKDGFAERLWDSPSDIAYAIAFDPSGRALIGTGNKGMIYRIESNQISTVLLTAPPTQVTAFLNGKNNIIYAVTGNVGNLYSIGPSLERTGNLESDVLDAGAFSYWGKAHVTATPNGGTIELEARSGNLNNPQHDWSKWGRVPIDPLGGQVAAPPARFLQYRLTLSCSPEGKSPDVSVVDIPYLPKNSAPRVDQVEIGPVNYRQAPGTSLLERNVAPSGSALSISLPAVGSHRPSPSTPLNETAGAATLQYNKGFFTLRWSASDPDHDPLLFKVELRAKTGSRWRVLKDNLQETHFALDSAAFPDGDYVARVTASDSPGNPPSQALSSELYSEPFIIDNTPPEILDIQNEKHGQRRVTRFTAKDAQSWIGKAEYSINGGEWALLQPTNRVTDSQALTYELESDPGQTVAIRVFDEDDNVVVKQIGGE
ncbi:MAG TPA: hypothetical protein VH351_06405 [Bryobacteraceae bacterium]|jgi:hypothetical protein|nr:hypothetical protein [Bryobacteraceae bacterium]